MDVGGRGTWLAFGALIVGEQTRTDTVRSFFGVNRVGDVQDGRFRNLAHGTTIHGTQRLRNDDGTVVSGAPEPLSCYFTGGAIADGIDAMSQARGGGLDRVAVVGVGTGSPACQMRPQENWKFYEIDAQVIRIATDPSRFRFVSACAPGANFVTGGARLTLADAADASLDMIVVDASSSDAIPTHLMTTEAMALYRWKLTADGAVLFHISNSNEDLAPGLAG